MTIEKKRIKLLEEFNKTSKKSQAYYKISGPGVYQKIRRFFLLRSKYLIYALSKKGLISKDLEARLFFGKNITLPSNDLDMYPMYFFGTLQPEESPLTRFFIKNFKENDIFYDIGANYGFYSYLAKTLINRGEVHSFEPNPTVFEYFKKNKKGQDIYLNNCAVGDKDGEVYLFGSFKENIYRSGSSSIVESVASYELNKDFYDHKISISSIRLDTYVKSNKPPTIVKIDVEGAEPLVIRGGENMLSMFSPVIIMEVWGGKRGEDFSRNAIQKLSQLEYKKISKINEYGEKVKIQKVDFSSIPNMSYENWVFEK